jgi:hypothetical protein
MSTAFAAADIDLLTAGAEKRSVSQPRERGRRQINVDRPASARREGFTRTSLLREADKANRSTGLIDFRCSPI